MQKEKITKMNLHCFFYTAILLLFNLTNISKAATGKPISLILRFENSYGRNCLYELKSSESPSLFHIGKLGVTGSEVEFHNVEPGKYYFTVSESDELKNCIAVSSVEIKQSMQGGIVDVNFLSGGGSIDVVISIPKKTSEVFSKFAPPLIIMRRIDKFELLPYYKIAAKTEQIDNVYRARLYAISPGLFHFSMKSEASVELISFVVNVTSEVLDKRAIEVFLSY